MCSRRRKDGSAGPWATGGIRTDINPGAIRAWHYGFASRSWPRPEFATGIGISYCNASNNKRLYRLYCEEGLSNWTRNPKRLRACRYRFSRSVIHSMSDVWAMDFMSDRLFDEKLFRTLAIVKFFTREALGASTRTRFKAYRVIDELDLLARAGGRHRIMRDDSNTAFADRLLDLWVYQNKVELGVSRPGKPPNIAYIEAFNNRPRQECLNAFWLLFMDDARTGIKCLRIDCNETRPHSPLRNLRPSKFSAHLNETLKVDARTRNGVRSRLRFF